MKLFDPTSDPVPRAVAIAPRPRDLRGLRLALVENTKFNSDVILTRMGTRLTEAHGMAVVRMARKRSPSHAMIHARTAFSSQARCPRNRIKSHQSRRHGRSGSCPSSIR